MEIREALTKDIAAIIKILIQVNEVHHNGRPDLFKGGASKYSQEDLESIFNDPCRKTFVMIDNAEVLGYIFCIIKKSKENNILVSNQTLYIDDLGVDARFRNQGIGSALLKYAEEYAKKIGCYNLTLNVWSLNASALKFYEKNGLKSRKVEMEKIL